MVPPLLLPAFVTPPVPDLTPAVVFPEVDVVLVELINDGFRRGDAPAEGVGGPGDGVAVVLGIAIGGGGGGVGFTAGTTNPRSGGIYDCGIGGGTGNAGFDIVGTVGSDGGTGRRPVAGLVPIGGLGEATNDAGGRGCGGAAG